MSFCSSEQLEEHAQQKLQERRRIKEVELKSSTIPVIQKCDHLSALVFYIIKDKHLKIMIPDYEVTSCKEIFEAMSCHESCFGLARLLCHEGKFQMGLDMLNSALGLREDPLYRLWQAVLTVKLSRQVEAETIQNKSFFQGFFCCSPVRSQSNVMELLGAIKESPELLWSYMELSMKGHTELEAPEFYAARIKEESGYLGYLAWSEVFFRRNEWHKGVDILKQLVRNYSSYPESYVKLWYHYYYNVKDYEQAYDVVSEALLMLTSPEVHQFYILFCFFSAKSLFKLKKIRECIDFLHRKFLENPTYPIFLYHYGRYCTKSEDFIYNGSAIGSLQECIRLCDSSKYGQIYYWLAKAYMLGRQHIDAYDTVKLALSSLDPGYSRKMAELKRWISEIQTSVHKIEQAEAILIGDLDEIKYKKFKELCAEVKDLHKLAVDVLYAKILWKTGRYEEALKKLYAVSGISTVKMTAHFLLLQYLEEQRNLKCMKTVACEMVIKCKNPQVPTHIWVKVNLMYAKILLKNNKPGKAILILKCMAKVLPPTPFVDIPYTKLLKRATNLQELSNVNAQSIETFNAYTYSTYKNSFITPMVEARDFSEKLIAEEAAPLPIATPRMFRERRSERAMSDKIAYLKTYNKKKTQEDDKIEDEKKESTLLGVTIPDLSQFKPFSVCSDPTFLYKIAKISINHNICLHDGLCAIKDYIEFLKFEKDRKKKEKQMIKAKKIRSGLYQTLKEASS